MYVCLFFFFLLINSSTRLHIKQGWVPPSIRMIKLALLGANLAPAFTPTMFVVVSILEDWTTLDEVVMDPNIYGICTLCLFYVPMEVLYMTMIFCILMFGKLIMMCY